MKAAVVDAPGAAVRYGDFAEPVVGEGREQVDLVAAGIHNVVRSLASGRHYGSSGVWPLIPGVDAVARTPDGALIYTGFVEPPYGTLAERMAVPSTIRLTLPAGVEAVAIAGGLNPGLSSWMPLAARKNEITDLGTVLILGVTGMAGFLAVQNAHALSASRVVGAGRSASGLERAAAAGAIPVTLTGDRDADAAQVVSALDGAAPSIVIDFVWGGPAEAAFLALARHGLGEDSADIAYVEIGAMAGPEAAVPSSLLRSRHIRIAGSGAGSASIADLVAQIPVYMQLIAGGRVVVPTRVFTLAQIGEAWAAAGDGGDRVVVVPS
jgi:NADPH:quinone reductase-like Zn-dependent oxidoreductase